MEFSMHVMMIRGSSYTLTCSCTPRPNDVILYLNVQLYSFSYVPKVAAL